ncbi:MAG: iron-containing alcohol dehydrogenase [Caldilineaceae bacterium]|nr:iron-containing alcohol dehydrogenase [Caldilineaceae bacterium]
MPTTIPTLPIAQIMPFSAIEEERPVLLVTSAPAWDAVADRLHLPITARVDVTEATLAHWDALFQGAEDAAVVYAVGGGLAVDAAKYVAANRGLPLICLPTALSVDAFLTTSSGIRRDGCVVYIPTKAPQTVILDWGVLGAAPPSIRAAGICDLLSIATGCWDWRFAHERVQNPPGMAYIPWVEEIAQAILRASLDCAEAAGRGDPDGLKTLYDCLALEVQLCNQIGHSRPEEGSEHYFAYAAEDRLGHGLPHGDLVGPGILIAAERQGQERAALERALRACHIPLHTIPADVVAATLAGLPDYCRTHNLPYSRAHEP